MYVNYGEKINILPEEYRNVIGHLASGVSVITTTKDEERYGLTASAVTSLALDPPMLLVCINKSTGTAHAIKEVKKFGVNILHAEQGDLAKRFATPNIDKFDGVDITLGEGDVPFLKEAHVSLECHVTEIAEGGTHYVFLAKVSKAEVNEGTDALVYYKGKFGKFDQQK